MFAIVAVAVIAVVAVSGFMMLNNRDQAPYITISYTYLHGRQTEPDAMGSYSYNGTASWVVFTLNATSTKDVAVFDLSNSFTVTSNDQPLTVLKVNPSETTLYSDKSSEGKIGFVVEGDVNTFELVYTGSADVTIT